MTKTLINKKLTRLIVTLGICFTGTFMNSAGADKLDDAVLNHQVSGRFVIYFSPAAVDGKNRNILTAYDTVSKKSTRLADFVDGWDVKGRLVTWIRKGESPPATYQLWVEVLPN